MRKQKDSSTMPDKSGKLRVTQTETKEILQKLDSLEDLLKKKDDKPLTFKEACAYLGYAPSYLYKLTYRKVIPHYKPTGKMIFFSKNELDEWIFKSSVASAKADRLRVQSDELKEEDASSSLSTKDSNQIEMNLGHEIVIEFPRKKKQK